MRKRLTELDYEDERRKCYIDTADGVEDRRALVLALRVADRVLAQGLGVRVRDVHDDEEEVSRHAEVEQEMDVQPDGVRGHERLLAYDYTNKSVQGRSVVVVNISWHIPDGRNEEEERLDNCTTNESPALFTCELVRILGKIECHSLGKFGKKRSHTGDFEPKDDGQRSRK